MKKLIQILSIAILFAITFGANAQGITYTLTTSGDLNDPANWTPTPALASPNVSGTGFADTWYVPIPASISYGNDWIITAGSSVILGDGTTAMTFAAGGYIYSDDFSQSISLTVNNNVSFYVFPDDIWGFTFDPASTTFATGSNVIYNYDAADYGAGGSSIIGPGSYYNITISNDASLYYGDITVNNTLDNSAILYMNNFSITLKNTITGTGSFYGSTGSTLDIESSGAVGTLNFTSGFQVLKKFKIGSGSATLNTDLLVSNVGTGGTTISTFDMASGSLDLNGHTLTLDKDNNTKLGATSSNMITGGGNSTLIINSKTLTSGNLYMDQTSSSTRTLKCLILAGGVTNNLTIANKLNITDSITITKGFFGVTTPGDLTLIANQTTVGQTGRMGVFGGTLVSGTKITSQVFHDPAVNQTNWILLGAAGITGSTMADWAANFAITCPTCPLGTGPFTSVQSYDETTGTTFGDALHYNGISGLSDPITNGKGYWVYLGTANPGINTPGELISIVGTPKVGGVTINLTNTKTSDLSNYGYNLISNPYPSPISWKQVMKASTLTGGSNLENNIYAYSPIYNGGDYVAYNASTGLSNPPSGTYTIGDIIPMGLGFYVQTNQNNSTLTFNEHVKVYDPNNQVLFRGGNSNPTTYTAQPAVNLSQTHYFNLQATGNGNESWATIAFNANATDTTDGYDAMALGYNGLLQISSTTSNTVALRKDYAINCQPDLIQNYTIPVKMLTGTSGQYLITPSGLENMLLGACLNLHDNLTNTDHDLRGAAFNVTLNASDTGYRFALQVTISQLPITVNVIQASCPDTTNGFVTVVGNNAGPWNYIWRDANGNIVKTSLNKASADSLTGLNEGVFTVEVNTVGSCDGAVQTFTFTSPVLASAFTAPAITNVGSVVTFTNSSANATSYNWNFGDGNTASQQSPNYTYSNAGTYTVTLYAINTVCNDTSISTQVVEVDAALGIKQAVAGSGNIFVSKDATGNYLQFNYTAQTKVNITVYNVLGQTVLSNAGLNVVTDKIYLNLNDSKNQVLYVTITDLTTNIQTTKKFVNN